jgi:hypothetical protein
MASPDQKIVTATWTTHFSADLWKKLEGRKALVKSEDYVVLGPTLPNEDDPRIAEVVVHRHEDQDELHWMLTVRAAPSSEPPESIKAHDRTLGGRAGLASLLAEGFAPGAPSIATFHIRLRFAEDRYCCTLIPTMVEKGSGHDAALQLGHAVRLEQIGYRFECGGAGGIQEVVLIYLHRDGKYAATAAATGPLKLSSKTWLPFADDVSELVQNTFFSPRETMP